MSSQTQKASEEFAWCLGTETHQMIDGKVPTQQRQGTQTSTKPTIIKGISNFCDLTSSVIARKPKNLSAGCTTNTPTQW